MKKGEPGVEVAIGDFKLIYLPQSRRLVIVQGELVTVAVIEHDNIPQALKAFVARIEIMGGNHPNILT
jgi:hypothetical protein